jgi:hypothetical protein
MKGACLMSLLLGLAACRQGAAGSEIQGTADLEATAEVKSEEGELGCVCQASSTFAGFSLMRYESKAYEVAPTLLQDGLTLSACVRAKFDPQNCQAAF